MGTGCEGVCVVEGGIGLRQRGGGVRSLVFCRVPDGQQKQRDSEWLVWCDHASKAVRGSRQEGRDRRIRQGAPAEKKN